MRAIVVTEPTGPQALTLVDAATPDPGPDQIRITVQAAGVNPADAQAAAGDYGPVVTADRPHTGLGWEVAGTVSAVGPGVTRFRVGDRVAALVFAFQVALGGYADEVVVPAEAAAPIPAGIEPVAAATVPLNALTAGQILELPPPAAGSLLVTGAAGAVGGFLVALAARTGWTVTALARDNDRDFLRRAGASHLVTALDQLPDGTAGTGFDALADVAELGGAALRAVREGGRQVGVRPYAVTEPERDIKTGAVTVHADAPRLQTLLEQAARGELEIRLRGTLPLADAGIALRQLPGRGRWVLVP